VRPALFRLAALGGGLPRRLPALAETADHRAGAAEGQEEHAVEGQPAEPDADHDPQHHGEQRHHSRDLCPSILRACRARAAGRTDVARPLALLVLAAAFALGCGRSSDPVQALLADLEDAAEDRDADRFQKLLAEDFRGAGGVDRAEAAASLRRYFALYESVGLEVYDVKVERSEGGAAVRLRVDFAGSARRVGGLEGFLPPAASYRFDLALSARGDLWLVTRADWESALPPPSP
jgi:hypothetical protein